MAMKLALDYFKGKYIGFLLIAHDVKVMDGDISATVKNQLCRRLEFAEVVPSIESVDKHISKQDKGPSEIDSYTNYATYVHANLSDEIIPRVGMEFDTKGDVYDFYNKYAKEVGFSICKSKGHKDLHGHWLNMVFCCSCQEHTHALASPSRRMFLRSQRKINLAQVAELEIADCAGLAPKESVGFLARKVAARAAMSEQSFDIAMSDGENTLSKVETTLKQLSIEDSLNMCTENKIPQADETEQIENNGKKVKGVKCKPRRKGDRSSIRPKNAPEKATGKRKRQGEQSYETPLAFHAASYSTTDLKLRPIVSTTSMRE
ncbi:hypothetical protein V6N11_043369 [Hibiscus sabdariffa]|uniref:Protein FAR1-RELATED SEQUENCE n=1 Tax=Hibiscus sabdariffa TaxID=183260 RepID=A0ABR2AAQ0_9ROSI